MPLDWRDFEANCLQTVNNNTKLGDNNNNGKTTANTIASSKDNLRNTFLKNAPLCSHVKLLMKSQNLYIGIPGVLVENRL